MYERNQSNAICLHRLQSCNDVYEIQEITVHPEDQWIIETVSLEAFWIVSQKRHTNIKLQVNKLDNKTKRKAIVHAWFFKSILENFQLKLRKLKVHEWK